MLIIYIIYIIFAMFCTRKANEENYRYFDKIVENTKEEKNNIPEYYQNVIKHIETGKIKLAAAHMKYVDIKNINKKNSKNQSIILAASKHGCPDIIKSAIELGAKVDDRDKNNNTCLHKAILNNHDPAFNLLIENGANLKCKNKLNQNSIILAAKVNNIKFLKKLLKYNQNLNVTDKKLQSPLVYAIQNQNVEAVEILINKGANVNYKTSKLKKSPIFYSIENNNLKIYDILIKNKANIELTNKLKQNILIYAIKLQNIDFTKQIIKSYSFLINKKDKYGKTAIFYALESKNKKIIDMLLNNTITDIDVTNNQRETPIFLAIKNNDIITLEKIINKKADIDIKNNKGVSPILMAIKLCRNKIIDILIKNKVRLNTKDKDGRTPIIYSVLYNKKILNHLLKNKCDIYSKDNLGKNVFSYTVKNSDFYSTNLILNNMNDEKKEKYKNQISYLITKENDSIFIYFLEKKYTELFKLLLHKLKNTNIKDLNKNSLIYIASKNNHKDIVIKLMIKGVSINEKTKFGKSLIKYIINSDNDLLKKQYKNLIIDYQKNRANK